MKVVATYAIKGGVGKTSAAVNIAWLSANDRKRTLLVDLDPQSAATYLFRIKPKVKGGAKALVRGKRGVMDAVKATDYDGLDLLPADFSFRNLDLVLDGEKKSTERLAELLSSIESEYDVVVLDCAPSISLVSENVIEAADVLLVPLVPATLSLRTYDQLVTFLGKLDHRPPAVLTFFSMVDRRRRLHRELVESLATERPEVGDVVVPAASAVEQMAVRRQPLVATDRSSEAATAYRQLWSRVTVLLQF